MFSGFGSFEGGSTGIPQKFEGYFRCYPISMMNDRIRKDDANYGGKIFLPPSTLNKLSMLNIRYPMLFELRSLESGKVTNGGVLEFVAEEGRTYLPDWMMETLGVNAGSLLQIGSTDILQGQFVKLEPQSVEFLDISHPKAVLENVLRKFSTLTVNDIIQISYNNKIYRIKILEVKPETESLSICVIETDLITEFVPPVGYVEPDYKALKAQISSQKNQFDLSKQSIGTMSRRIKYSELVQEANSSKGSFGGEGQKLSGKNGTKKQEKSQEDLKSISLNAPPAPLVLEEGQLFFGFPIVPAKDNDKTEVTEEKPHFQSQGQSLRQRNKRKGQKDHDAQRSKAPKSPELIQID